MKGVDVLRDRYGNRIGEIQIDDSKQVLVDRYLVRLGSYDSHDNLTRDKYRKRTRYLVEISVWHLRVVGRICGEWDATVLCAPSRGLQVQTTSSRGYVATSTATVTSTGTSTAS